MPSRRRLALAAAALLAPAARAHAQAAPAPAPPAAPAAAPRVAAGDSARPASVERLLAVSDAERLYNQTVESSIAGQLRNNPGLAAAEPVLRRFMAKYAGYAELKADMVRVYRETFTEAEVQELIRFYQSDFGRRLMTKLPLVMARSNELSAQRLQAHLPELFGMLQEQMGAGAAGGRP